MEYEWTGFGEPLRVPSYRRPLSAVINPLVRAGFVVEQILEPVPTEPFRQMDPDGYEELTRSPGFMCVRAARGMENLIHLRQSPEPLPWAPTAPELDQEEQHG